MLALICLAPLTLAYALQAAPSPAPEPPPALSPALAPKAEILGLWKGSSICAKVEGNEFCHDETVVYNVVDVPDRPEAVKIKAARIVDETVQPMYELFFTYKPETGAWASEFERPRLRGVWSYVVQGEEMKGTATVLPDGKVVRNVTVRRVARDEVLPR